MTRSGSDVLGERQFRQLAEDRFVLDATDLGVSFEIARLRRDRGSLIADLTVSSDLAGAVTFDGVLSAGDLFLTNPKARQERAVLLTQRARTSRIDFSALLEELALRVIAAERRGQPAILLRDAPRPNPDDAFEVEGFPLLKSHPVLIFGDGGTGKSLFGLYLAGHLARRGVTTAVIDWELSAEDHRDRLERLFGEDMPAVLYVRATRPLVYELDRLKRIVQDHGVRFLVADSVAFACDGPPEAAEVAGRYFNALRGLNVGSLNIAHVNKGEQSDQKPFGSSFWHNGARSTWFVKQADAQAEDGALTIGLFHRKANLGRLHKALGYAMTFGPDRTTIARADLTEVASLAARLPLHSRIRPLLARGPLTLVELAQELDAKVDSVEKAVKRSPMFARLTNTPDGQHRWALAERRLA